MLYTLKNEQFTVTVSDLGAELHSVQGNGCEYIWIGDPDIWKFKAPLCFPFCGRFYEGTYTYEGKVYETPCHGFIRPSTFTVEEKTDTSICLVLRESEETKKIYPFDFVLKVWYILEGNTLINRFDMENPDGERVLPITLGGHPGFNVPLAGEGEFTDYYLEFANPCSPDVFVMSENCLLKGKTAFYLEDGKRLRLRHDLFDHDAIFLTRTDTAVTLRSDKAKRSVTVKFDNGMPYLGIWHKPKVEAPYVCIEPWCGLPGHEGVMVDLATKPDMFRIEPKGSKSVAFSMTFE